MLLYFSGIEQRWQRQLVLDAGGTALCVKYLSLRQEGVRRAILGEEFAAGRPLTIASGRINRRDLDPAQVLTEYEQFCATNHEFAAWVFEYCGSLLDPVLAQQHRDRMKETCGPKFMPIWHAHDGFSALRSFAHDYDNISVWLGKNKTIDRQAISMLDRTVKESGTVFHGYGVASADALIAAPLRSTSHSVWQNPRLYGEFTIWDGVKLHHYHSKDADAARERHRDDITTAGFDAQRIIEGDGSYAIRLSIWSWLQFLSQLDKRVTPGPETSHSRNEPQDMTTLTNTPSPSGDDRSENIKSRAQKIPFTPRTRKPLPLFTDMKKLAQDPNYMTTCGVCPAAEMCPEAGEPEDSCAYTAELEIKDPESIRKAGYGLLNLQYRRTMRAAMLEEMLGNTPDPLVSQEFERTARMSAQVQALESQQFSLQMSIKGTTQNPAGQASIIDHLFGRDPAKDKTANSAIESSVKQPDFLDGLGLIQHPSEPEPATRTTRPDSAPGAREAPSN